MKKLLFLLVCIMLLPISVFARTATKDDLMEVIDSTENIQVEENVKILSMSVGSKEIELTLLENDLPEVRYVPYHFEENELVFEGGTVQKNTLVVENNRYAFYLYSILENMSTCAYDENSYFNETLIQKKADTMPVESTTFQNWGKTFGLTLENKGDYYQISYHYYLDGDDTIIINKVEESIDGEFTNPSTGNFSSLITIALMLVVGLAGYTAWGPIDKKKLRRSH